MTDAGFKQIEHDGTVSAIVAPCGFHHLGIVEWKTRFPRSRVFAHPLAAERIKKKGDVGDIELAPLDDLRPMLPDHVWLATPPGMKHPDTMLRVTTEAGPIWYCNDMVLNFPEAPGNFLTSMMFKLTKSAPGFRVGRLPARLMVKDKPTFRDWFANELEQHPPRFIVSGHGPPIIDTAEAQKLAAMVRAAY